MPPEPAPHGIEWNKVTWYSKLGAIILFIGVVPLLTFYIGMQYQAVLDTPLPSTSNPKASVIQLPTAATSCPMDYRGYALSDVALYDDSSGYQIYPKHEIDGSFDESQFDPTHGYLLHCSYISQKVELGYYDVLKCLDNISACKSSQRSASSY